MRKAILPIAAVVTLLVSHWSAAANVKVADITRLDGQQTNELTSTGLVTGLKGTGDGGEFVPAMNQLKQVLSKLGYPTQLLDLNKAQNVAIVLLRAVIPSDGVHKGDHVDVRVTSLGAATSLKGGSLFICPMAGPVPTGGDPYAFSSGDIKIDDPTEPNVGTIHGGCTMEADLLPQVIEKGKFTLILEGPSASWTTANTIATIINDLSDSKEETLATAVNSKTVVVTIPATELKHPDAFISRVLQLPVLLLPTEARVVINDHDGTMIITGDVEISPVMICHRGLTITTIDPKPKPTPQNPVTSVKDIATLDTTQQGGAKLEDLAIAFDQLKVPVADRIEIVTDLYRSGKLHAKLFINDKEL